MRHGKFWTVLAALAAAGCATPEPMQDMVGYVPPTSLPAQPKRTLVAAPKDRVWDQLVDFLEGSAFEVDHLDEAKSLLVARYSGNPEPFIDCGSIVTHEGGTLGQIAGSSQTVELSYELQNEPVMLNRALSLDSRIIIRLADQPRGTLISTDTTYVVTKTINVTGASNGADEGNRETVSFQAGGRAEFSKGTTCQPNGSLDVAVLESLPNVIGSEEIERAELELPESPIDSVDIVESGDIDNVTVSAPDGDRPEDTVADTSSDVDTFDAAALPTAREESSFEESEDIDWILPEQGLPKAALPAPATTLREDPAQDQTATATEVPLRNLQDEGAEESPAAIEDEAANQVANVPETGDQENAPLEAGSASGDLDAPTIVDETTRQLLASLDCGGEEWHFCELVELTTPYRKRNIERLFGLTMNTTESFASQFVGRDLKLDVLFPSFPASLHIAYARRDGSIDHVMSSEEVWPADLSHQLSPQDQAIPGPPGLAMLIAVATEEPLFSSPPPEPEDATAYLDRLKERLAELETENPDGQIAATQLLIFVENAGS